MSILHYEDNHTQDTDFLEYGMQKQTFCFETALMKATSLDGETIRDENTLH